MLRPCWSLQCKPYNLRETKVIRDLNPSDVDSLISVSGMVTRTSNVIPDLRWVTAPQALCRSHTPSWLSSSLSILCGVPLQACK